MTAHSVLAWQRVAVTRLAELQDACKDLPQLLVLRDRLWASALGNPARNETVKLVALGLAKGGLALVSFCGEGIGDYLRACLALARHLDVEPLILVARLEVEEVAACARAIAGRGVADSLRV